MKKINFSRIEIYTDVSREHTVMVDMRKSFANTIYQNGSGIDAHALALKIYGGDGEQEFSGEELDVIKRILPICTPFFIDAMNNLL